MKDSYFKLIEESKVSLGKFQGKEVMVEVEVKNLLFVTECIL